MHPIHYWRINTSDPTFIVKRSKNVSKKVVLAIFAFLNQALYCLTYRWWGGFKINYLPECILRLAVWRHIYWGWHWFCQSWWICWITNCNWYTITKKSNWQLGSHPWINPIWPENPSIKVHRYVVFTGSPIFDTKPMKTAV